MKPQRVKMVQGVPPLVFTAYAANGRVLMRSQGFRPGNGVTIPRDLRKRVAKTEVMDARGEVIDVWHAPWATEGE